MKKLISVYNIKAFSASGEKILFIDPGTIVTPSAKDAASEFGITIKTGVKEAEKCCEKRSDKLSDGKGNIIEDISKAALKEVDTNKQGIFGIPTGISNRHVHLTQDHQDILFGKGKTLTKMRDLSQPGQYVCQELVTLIGPSGVMEKVRILGPVRKQTQVELLAGDCIKLGVKAPVRESGKLEGSGGGLTIVGPVGCVWINEGVIIAQRHIHMHISDANRFNVVDGKIVSIKVDTPRGGILNDTVVRVSEKFKLDFHIDFDEANALMLKPGDIVTIL